MSKNLNYTKTAMSPKEYKAFAYFVTKWKSTDTLIVNGVNIYRNTYATGRIKRMRNPKKIQDYHRGYSVRLKATKDKFKIWDMLWYQNQEFSYPFTRWNRH